MTRPVPRCGSKSRANQEEQITARVRHVEAGISASVPRAPRSAETGRKTIAYHKIGRSMLLDPEQWGPVGGDNEPLYMLLTLARRHPDVNWVVAGRHGGDPGNLPANVIVPEVPTGTDVDGVNAVMHYIYANADGALLWLGQHGTSNVPTPQLKEFDTYTYPQDASLIYVGSTTDALNRVGPPEDGGYEPVWLCADPRNYLKARDVKWYPHEPILGQFDFERQQRHYRWGDPRTPAECHRPRSTEIENGHWLSPHSYEYSGLELTGVPRWEDGDPGPAWEDRVRFGIVVNEARAYVTPAMARATIIRKWVTPLDPDFIHGKWTKDGAEHIGFPTIKPVHYLAMQETATRARSTFTTPTSGSEWATAKPWEMFALGVVCFFHPKYDTQGHILPNLAQLAAVEDDELRYLAWWLRPRTPEELRERVDAVSTSRETYEFLAQAQRRVLKRARDEDRCYRTIERRLGLT